jgi:ribosome-binding protein aMBF1 (putative translation factor)
MLDQATSESLSPVFSHYKKLTEVTVSYRDAVQELVEHRHALGISQEELAQRIGCASSLIHKWEQHKRVPSGFLFTCWLDALGCQITISFKDTDKN